ncbi:MAG: hypothetical protein JO142_21200 [Burkholderiales bacterium]|nr:hypothetical protein [Burkholderiales bacterium]
MMKIDGFLPDQQYVSSDSRRMDAANQRDAWLKQMEGAQFSLLEQSNSQTPQQGEKRPEAHRNQADSQPPAHQSRALEASPVVAMKPVHAADAGGDSQRAATAVDAATSHVARSHTSNAPNTSSPSAKPGGDAPAGLPHDGAMADLAMYRADIQPGQFTYEVAVGPASAVVLDAETEAPSPVQQIQVQTSAAAGMTFAAANQTGHAGTAEDAPTESPSDAQTRGEHKEASATGEPWQKRMMHLTADGQDVSVSIRDSQLNHQTSSQVIYRLAGDVAAAGFRLRSATVNGKALLRPTREASTSQRRAPRDAASPSTLSISNLDFLEQNHGA